MQRLSGFRFVLSGVFGLAVAAGASAQPRIISVGQPVSPAGVTNTGSATMVTTNVGIKTLGVGASVTVSPVAAASFVMSPNGLTPDGLFAAGGVPLPAGLIPLVTTTGNTITARWSQATNVWTNMPNCGATPSLNVASFGSSGNSSGVNGPRGMSQNGRYIVGQGNVYAVTAAANFPVSGSSFRFRPWIWDTQTNIVKILPTPIGFAGASTPDTRNRDGRALCVSNDGSVIMGAWDPGNAGANGGRMVVWYRDALTGEYAPDSSVTNNGADATWMAAASLPEGTADNGRTVDSFFINAAGTLIVGTSFDAFDIDGNPNPGTPPANTRTYLTKWTRPDTTTHTWTRTKLYDFSASQASATPGSISSWWIAYDCNAPLPPPNYMDPSFIPVGMSDDASTIAGILVYSTCGSFKRGGWIWKAGTGPGTGMMDLYDYLVAQNAFDIEGYGIPAGATLADHTAVQLGTPTSISSDGSTIVGTAGPFTPGGPGWIVKLNGNPAVAPFIAGDAVNVAAYSRCSALQFVLAAGGSGNLSYQWHFGTPGSGAALTSGQQASGSVIANLTPSSLQVNFPNLSDQGSYYCVISSSNGGSVTSTPVTATAQYVSAIANDLCSSAQNILLCANAADNTNQLSYEACAAYIDEFRTGTLCFAGTSSADAWFRYTPASSGDIRVENCNSTYFSSVITVYDGCLQNGGSEIACSITNGGTLPSCSKVRINHVAVTANNTIYIRVANQGSPSAGSSTGSVKIYPAPATPSNDGCANPSVAVLGSNAYDTSEAGYNADEIIGGAVSCSAALSRDVWFVFTAPFKGTAGASTCYNAAVPATPLTTPNTVLTAFAAACGGTEIVCNDNALRTDCGATGAGTVNTSFFSLGAMMPQQQVWIRVGGNNATASTAVGSGTLTMTLVPIKCNAADVAGLGGSPGFDGQLTPDDIVLYLAAFFSNNLAIADLVSLGGNPPSDGQITPDDLVYFLDQFFSPCTP
ncbi:MAG: GC-type dockerin domain-anchored protein [Phycisphaerales bacterium]